MACMSCIISGSCIIAINSGSDINLVKSSGSTPPNNVRDIYSFMYPFLPFLQKDLRWIVGRDHARDHGDRDHGRGRGCVHGDHDHGDRGHDRVHDRGRDYARGVHEHVLSSTTKLME